MNLEAGPDFQRAYIQVDRAAPVECDVEIDVASGGWQQHRHHTNPAFFGVGLQVVWQAGNGWPTDLPVVELKDQLDAPVGELSHALGQAPTAQPPGTLGRCAAPLADLPTDDVHALFGQAAETRLRAKAGALAAVASRGPTGGRRSGRDCSPRWATSKTVDPCGAWPNCCQNWAKRMR